MLLLKKKIEDQNEYNTFIWEKIKIYLWNDIFFCLHLLIFFALPIKVLIGVSGIVYVVFLPLLGMVSLYFIKTWVKVTSITIIEYCRVIGLLSTLLAFFYTQQLWFFFDKSYAGFQFCDFLFSDYTISIFGDKFLIAERFGLFGLDGISFFFFYLTTLIFPFCMLSGWKRENLRGLIYFSSFLLFLEFLLLLAFATMNIFVFYIAFEATLIPMFFIIGIWGSGVEKIRAAYFFFFFTFIGSLFFIFAIFIFHTLVGSTNFLIILTLTNISFELELFLFFCLSLGFAVKIPIFPLHTWLPEAHVQAPTEGSVILASLLLKLGGYGFIRLVLPICFKAVYFFSPVFVGLSICGILFGSMSAVVQLDLKKLIAYSSVAHMNLVVLGLFSLNLQGIQGAIFLMLAHGIVSSGLFFLIGFLYDRHHTRVITYYSGLAQRMPNFSTFFFLFILANVSFPGTSNFVGEILIFAGLIQKSFIVTFFAGFGIILSAVYSFFALNRIIYLTPTPHIKASNDLTRLEFNTLVYLTLLIFILGIFPGIILDLTRLSVQLLLQILN